LDAKGARVDAFTGALSCAFVAAFGAVFAAVLATGVFFAGDFLAAGLLACADTASVLRGDFFAVGIDLATYKNFYK
jgi:hypothetical protein